MKGLHKELGDEVQFFFIYCREAHAIDGERPGFRTLVEDPMTTAERRSVARDFVEELEFDMPALLDKVDDYVSTAYAAHPDRLYLIGKDGKIAFAGDQGPRGFKPDELKEAILVETGKTKTD